MYCVSTLFPQDDEINQQSQLLEKLKQQMLDQEEVTPQPFPHSISHRLSSQISLCASVFQLFLLARTQSDSW